MLTPCPNPWVSAVPRPQHGSAASNSIPVLYDFSHNLNPLGPPPDLLLELRDAVLLGTEYPEMDSGRARRALGEWLGIDPYAIVLGNGSSELILLTALAFLCPGRRSVVLRPSYMEYERATLTVGGEPVHLDLQPDAEFRWHPDAISAFVEAVAPTVVWLGNPHNPTGQAADPEALRHLVLRHRNVLWVIDEAYVELSTGVSALGLAKLGNVLVLRSLTKACALPGIRAGFAVAADPVAEVLRRLASPWNVNVIAQTLATVAPKYASHGDYGARVVSRLRKWMEDQLGRLGMKVVPSDANFVLVMVPGGEGVPQRLLKRGIMVRDCSSLGLEGYVRIGIRPRPELEVLLTNLREVLG